VTIKPISLPERTITVQGIRLRPFTEADLPAVARALLDPNILSWAAGRSVARARPDERAHLWLQARRTSWADGIALYAVTDADDGTLLGSISVRDIDRLPDQAVVGYWVTPAARGRGVASRALDAASYWAFSPLEDGGLALHRINLDHVLLNTGSCKVALKADFQIEGTMRDYFIEANGRRHDAHLHARLATDRAAQPEGYATALVG
jgi:RimJ/RimL family protein N-acetyltransferase